MKFKTEWRMRAFEVSLNGKRLCIAGLDAGILIAMVEALTGTHQELDLRVSGRADATNEHVDWVKQDLAVGDTVQIKIVEVSEADVPVAAFRERT